MQKNIYRSLRWLLLGAAVALAAQRDRLPLFTDIPCPGYTLTGHEMAQSLATVLDRSVRIKQMSWLPMQIARPFWPLGRCLLEMRYLWNTPHSLDGTAFRRALPEFLMTPVEEALRACTAHIK